MNLHDLLQLVIAGLSLVVSTIVLIFLARQLRLLRKQLGLFEIQTTDTRATQSRQLELLTKQVTDSRESLDRSISESIAESKRRREQATLDFIAMTLERQHALIARIPAPGSPAYAEFLPKAFERSSDEYSALRDYLAYLEDLSVGVNMEIFSREVVDRSIGGRLIRAWDLNAEWIRRERAHLGNDRLYEEIERVAGRIQAAYRTDGASVQLRWIFIGIGYGDRIGTCRRHLRGPVNRPQAVG